MATSAPVGAVSGLASGIQWSDMINQIMTLEQSRQLDPLTAEQTKEQAEMTAWNNYKTVVSKLSDAASSLRDGSSFDNFAVTGGTDPDGKTLLTATASSGATAGTYRAEVVDVARAEKLGGSNVADVNAAMNLSGDFDVGGKQVSIVATDSLSAIRNKINAVNTGSSPSRVSASILTVSSGVNRLVLSSDTGGSAGIELVEKGGSSVLSGLGVVGSSLVANTLNGQARGYGFTSSITSIAQTLGGAMPAAGSFKVNGNRVDVDLSSDSLSSIASKINAAAGASTATVSNEVVNGTTVSRLIVNGTVTTNPDDGAAAEAVSTQNLQQLGFLENDHSASQLIPPTDAQVRIDGVLIRRSTNTISDALAGVTLNLQQAAPGTTVDLTVSRDNAKTVQAIQDYATAYNAVAKFVSAQSASGAALAFNSTLRGSFSSIKNVIFSNVVGSTNSTYTRQPLVGVSLDKAGQMQVDTTLLNQALSQNPTEVRSLFATAGSTTSNALSYMTASTKTQPGSYAVSITQAATTPTATSSAIAGTYGNSSVANQMSLTDSFTGHTVTVSLADDDTASSLAQKLNTAFAGSALRVGSSVNGGSLQLTGTQYGTAAALTVAFALNGTAAASQLGFAPTPYTGTNVQGTINGKSATGAGQLLTANAPDPGDTNPAEGLALLYTGTGATTSSASYVLGVGGMLYNAANPLVAAAGGVIAAQTQALQASIDALTQRQAGVQTRLDQQRQSLTTQFTAMETALSKLQAQSSALASQLNSLQKQTS